MPVVPTADTIEILEKGAIVANGFTVNELLQALQFAIMEAQEIAEDQHARQIAEYFDEDGAPITIPLKMPNPHPRVGEEDTDGNIIPDHVVLEVPKITLVPQNSLVIKELEMNMEVPIGNMLVEKEPWHEDEVKEFTVSDEEWDSQKVKNRLSRRRSKRSMVNEEIKRLQITGKGSFFSTKNKQTAKLRIRFEGQEPPEVVARIEQSLVKSVET